MEKKIANLSLQEIAMKIEKREGGKGSRHLQNLKVALQKGNLQK